MNVTGLRMKGVESGRSKLSRKWKVLSRGFNWDELSRRGEKEDGEVNILRTYRTGSMVSDKIFADELQSPRVRFNIRGTPVPNLEKEKNINQNPLKDHVSSMCH